MFEKLENISFSRRAGLGLITLTGIGVAIGCKLYQSGGQNNKETLVRGIPYTETQFRRAGCALVPFVEEWKLSLNPENLDLMAYVVLKHASSQEGLDSAENYQQIDDSVRELINEDRESHARMLEAWQRDIDSRQ